MQCIIVHCCKVFLFATSLSEIMEARSSNTDSSGAKFLKYLRNYLVIRSTLYSLYIRKFSIWYVYGKLYNLHSYKVVGGKVKPTTNLQKSTLSCIIFRSSKFKNFASKCKLVHLDMIPKEGSCSSFCLDLVYWAW